MLNPEQWEIISKQASQIYSQLELDIIEEIATRIANVGYANTVVHNDILIAQEMGLLYEDIINLVAKYNNASATQIQNIFESAGVKSLAFDDKIYKEAGLNPTPIKQSKSMLQLLLATASKTNNNLNNLCMTTVNNARNDFLNAINNAYLEVSTGVKSYTSAIIDTIDKVSKKGAIVTYPSGRKMSIESAVRMNIITGVNQTCGKLQEMRADEMGWDLMELTAHGGARPEHAEWQGKIVSRSGQKGYLSLDDIGYGEPTGFKGVNCRHDWYPYFKGSSRTYTQEQLNNWKNETVTYNGKEISKYDVTQIQRRMERQIKQDKKDIAGIQGILTSNNKDDRMVEEAKQELLRKQNKLNEHNSIFNDFIKQTDSKKDYSRLYTGKNKNESIQKEDNIIPQYKSLLKQQFKRYSEKELKQISKETNNIVNNYIDNKSKWSGKLTILKQGIKEKGITINYAKLWNCNILVSPEVAPSMIIHEQIHAHSISYYKKDVYKNNAKIEEATVQLMTKEICKKENIYYEKSQYEDLVNNLEEINKMLKIKNTNLEFAQEIIKISPEDRIAYIERQAMNLSISEWEKLGNILEELRG